MALAQLDLLVIINVSDVELNYIEAAREARQNSCSFLRHYVAPIERIKRGVIHAQNFFNPSSELQVELQRKQKCREEP